MEADLSLALSNIVDARTYLAGFPAFAAYFALSLVLTLLVFGLYWRITPHNEVKLVREGNPAAILALIGALIGFALPLRSTAIGAMNLIDFALWALIAGVVQITAYFIARLFMRDLSERITRGEIGAGIWLGGIAIFVGILNSGALSY